MIKAKHFTYSIMCDSQTLDEQINNFLLKTNTEILNIALCNTPAGYSALIIYKITEQKVLKE